MAALQHFFTLVPLEWFIFGGIALVLAADTLRAGMGRDAALSVALPLSLVLHSFLKSAAIIGSIGALSGSTMIQAAIFVVLLALSYFMVRRMGLDFLDGGMGQPIQAILVGVATAVIVAVVWLQVPVLSQILPFGNQTRAIFAEQFRLWWLLGSYLALAFARG